MISVTGEGGGGFCPTKMHGGFKIANLVDVYMHCILPGSHVKMIHVFNPVDTYLLSMIIIHSFEYLFNNTYIYIFFQSFIYLPIGLK